MCGRRSCILTENLPRVRVRAKGISQVWCICMMYANITFDIRLTYLNVRGSLGSLLHLKEWHHLTHWHFEGGGGSIHGDVLLGAAEAGDAPAPGRALRWHLYEREREKTPDACVTEVRQRERTMQGKQQKAVRPGSGCVCVCLCG